MSELTPEQIAEGVRRSARSQRQDSVIDQLRDLAAIADREGMYDAADFIRDRINAK
jgi:hypothetical protein